MSELVTPVVEAEVTLLTVEGAHVVGYGKILRRDDHGRA